MTQRPDGIDVAKASRAFAEAESLSKKDADRLWGRPLYGPMIFVSPATREAVANQADGNGVLHEHAGVYVGILPNDVVVANTAVDWAGKRWTMVMWPLPERSEPRTRLLAHELFHRIQTDLHLPLANPQNPHLDALEGRVWLQLEWRALAAALITAGDKQIQAVSDALAFRLHRQHLFPGSAESERSLELNEGLAEYTGVTVASPDVPSSHWRIMVGLTDPKTDTFVRSFAYTSGPAYGCLLDERLPNWRTALTAQSNLGTLLASTIHLSQIASVDERARMYGAAALRTSESERAALADAEKARYRKLLVDGPTLTLRDGGKFAYGFDPNNLVPLLGVGTVYPTMQVSDVWGTMDVQGGALLSQDFKTVRVAAPADIKGTRIAGPGWTLDLAPGWHIVPNGAAGSYLLDKE